MKHSSLRFGKPDSCAKRSALDPVHASKMLKPAVIDTNIVVSGLITGDASSPTARILGCMLRGEVLFLMSEELLAEYASALRRPRLVKLHRLTDAEIDILLAEIVANSLWREPKPTREAPDSGDNHLWRLLAAQLESILVTGDKLLLNNPPAAHSAISPRSFVELYLA